MACPSADYSPRSRRISCQNNPDNAGQSETAGQDIFLDTNLQQAIKVIGDVGEVQLSIDDDGADLVLHSIVHTPPQSIMVDTHNRIVLPFAPSWLLNGAYLVNIGEYTPMTEQLLHTPLLRVPAKI